MSMIVHSYVLCKKLSILLKKHQKLLLTEEMQKLLIFPWLNEHFAPTNPVLPSLPQTKLFLSCNPLFLAILKSAVATWLNTAEVLAELQLLLMQGNQLIGIVPLWRLITSPADPGTVVQSSLFSLVEGSVSFLLSWLSYPKIIYSDMVRVLIFCVLSENLDSKEDISECFLQVSVPHLRKPLAEYHLEK